MSYPQEFVDAVLSSNFDTYLSSGNDEAIAEALNAPDSGGTVTSTIRLSSLVEFLMSRGKLKAIYDGQSNANLTIANICSGLIILLQGSSDREFNPADPVVESMMNGLIAGGLISDDDKVALIAICQKPISKSMKLLGRPCNHIDVATVIRG